MQFVEYGGAWDEAIITSNKDEFGRTQGLYLAAILPTRNPHIALQGFVDTNRWGHPELLIFESAPRMRLLEKDLPLIERGIKNSGEDRYYSAHALSDLTARHNQLVLGLTPESADLLDTFKATLGTDGKPPRGVEFSGGGSRNIHDMSEPPSLQTSIRGVPLSRRDTFRGWGSIFESRPVVEDYAEIVNKRMKILSIEPINFQDWRRQALESLKGLGKDNIVDGEVIDVRNFLVLPPSSGTGE